jgi:hypothetical protein
MNFDNGRRPIRVTQVAATQPAMPPTGHGEQAWRAQQVRMSAVHAASRVFEQGAAFPIGTALLDIAAQIEHYILTGETENPKESQP